MELKIDFNEPVKVSLSEQTVTVSKGDKSESKTFRCKNVNFSLDGNSLVLKGINSKKRTTSIMKTVRKQIANLVLGLDKGYEYNLRVVFSHFPINLQVSGKFVIINNFGGEKKPRKAKIIGENTKVDIKGKEITVTGSNSEHVGQTAANLEKATKIKNKDLRVFQDSIYLLGKGLMQKGKDGA
ncbi:MAG: 50S ribosomal protein L6 [Candidatus Diapherotrites archaeon]|nr:50S ribosomal protein L6 [Candidatus Diapherotrites archaeon]